ncbi:MAG: amidase [Haliscomenobacter sp.]|uniref:amidase n=1 Tax=Haliscomenobacter sp. TaxID=2717303 RepID=UPI0029BBD769|nr:amidase [Haliscomenobacter sp.]MDX2072241.1 amidase [Haliscomenobacter sp.]
MKKTFRLFLLLSIIFVLGAFSGRFFGDKISSEDVVGAAKIAGLELTQSEIDSLLPGLEDARNSYVANRKTNLTNDLGPAIWFNPLLPGMKIPTGPDKVNFGKVPLVRLPQNRDDLAWCTVRELAELLRTRQISSEELTRFFLNRLKKYDPQLHCVITLTEDLAIEQAKRADAEIKAGKYRGLLHGIPYGAKDLLATRNYKTTWGSVPYQDQVLNYDATVIKKLEAAGAVLCAKLTMGELAWGDVWFGEMTRNPWDTKAGSSGSSAGSASSVSAGLLPFAIGTETLGSIVSPSTVCGTSGLRPTYGRVSRHGAMALSWSMDKIGPICRSVEDCAIVFNAIQGPDPQDVSLIPAAFHYDASADPRQLKIGYLKKDFDRRYAFHDQDSVALEKLKAMGFKLVPIELPESPDLSVILSAEAAAAFDELTLSGRDDLMRRQIKNAWPNSFRESRFIPAVEYIKANRLRTKLMQDMQKVFEQVDVYVHPSWGSRSLNITNHTGHPCVVIPNGFRNGRPTSLSFTGRLFEEGKILNLAKVYQEATTHHKQHPVL